MQPPDRSGGPGKVGPYGPCRSSRPGDKIPLTAQAPGTPGQTGNETRRCRGREREGTTGRGGWPSTCHPTVKGASPAEAGRPDPTLRRLTSIQDGSARGGGHSLADPTTAQEPIGRRSVLLRRPVTASGASRRPSQPGQLLSSLTHHRPCPSRPSGLGHRTTLKLKAGVCSAPHSRTQSATGISAPRAGVHHEQGVPDAERRDAVDGVGLVAGQGRRRIPGADHHLVPCLGQLGGEGLADHAGA
jgi:hypothetical protein